MSNGDASSIDPEEQPSPSRNPVTARRLADWYKLMKRVDGVFEDLSKPSSSAKEKQQKAAETRVWSIVAAGLFSLGLSYTVFGGDDSQLVEKLGMFGMRPTVSGEPGE